MTISFCKGDKGADVTKLQTALAAVGFRLDVDGDFGPQTDKCVRAYQKANGLAIDGIAGPATLAALGIVATDVAEQPVGPFSDDGWYASARRCPSHPVRVGGTIDAKSIVAHTTDCFPGTMPVVLRAWKETIGQGQCAHFYLGKRAPTAAELLGEEIPSCGVVQMVPITHNANHAGGPVNGHGWYRINGQLSHPNLWAVGIEIDNAGRLVKSHGVWIHADSQKPIADANVFVDSDGRGWERVTDYQLDELGKLCAALHERLAHFPDGTTVAPNGDHKANGVAWAATAQARFVAHATLDPINKTDCGPQVFDYLRQRFGF